MNLASWLAAAARVRPAAPALLRGTTVVAAYSELARRAGAVALWLRDVHGVRPGDRVALFMRNRAEYLECLYGVLWAGAVVVPVNCKLHEAEVAWIVENAQAALTLTEPPAVDGPALAEPVPRAPEDLAWLFYTSGTTGRPKGAMLTHANLAAMSLSYLADVEALRPGDAMLYAAPFSHGAGLYNFVGVRMGVRHVVPESGGFDADEVLDLGRGLGDVSLFAAPTMVRRLVDAARRRGEDGEGLRTIVYGGGPMYEADLADALEVLGQRFVQIYAQGETPMTITALSREAHADPAHPERLRSVGTAHSVVSVRVTGPDGTSLPAGETGEIEVRGATVMAGYWRNPEATAETLVDRWLRTGDVGRLDADGFLTLSDRSKDVIISGGTNIYPREVEEVLVGHPAVREAAVVGVPDPEWGENVVAFVVMDGEADLDAHCLAYLARFKRPKSYVLVDELPKNNHGKVLKRALRELVAR